MLASVLLLASIGLAVAQSPLHAPPPPPPYQPGPVLPPHHHGPYHPYKPPHPPHHPKPPHYPPVESRSTQCEPVPGYVIDFAPLVHLAGSEHWWPAKIDAHLSHTVPEFDYNLINGAPKVINSSNADFAPVDHVDESQIYYTSLDDVEDNPSWLLSASGRPDASGKSVSPATIVVVDKSDIVGPGVVDAFYFMFYSYNHGPEVLGAVYGNHVGDWEYVMIRFQNGKPLAAWLSQHGDGAAYTFDALEKYHGKPVIYSAAGSHTTYPNAGKHNFKLPFGIISDSTDAGLTWNLAANYNAFWYSKNAGFEAAQGTKQSPHFLNFLGHWGDKQYAKSDPRQRCVKWATCHYIDGPTGPITENLSRVSVCKTDPHCKPAPKI